MHFIWLLTRLAFLKTVVNARLSMLLPADIQATATGIKPQLGYVNFHAQAINIKF